MKRTLKSFTLLASAAALISFAGCDNMNLVSEDSGATVSRAAAETESTVEATEASFDFTSSGTLQASYFGGISTSSSTTLSEDIVMADEESGVTVTFTAAGTGVGNTTGTPAYKNNKTSAGVCFKKDAIKVTGVKGNVSLTITAYQNSSTSRNLEVTIGSGTTEVVAGGLTSGTVTYNVIHDFAENGETIYIGSSNELFLTTIAIKGTEEEQEEEVVDISALLEKAVGYTGSSITYDDNFFMPKTRNMLSSRDVNVGYGTIEQQHGQGTVVSTKDELVAALAEGGLIYVNGMIDMSEGLLPSVGGGTNDALDAFVAENSDFTDYMDFKAHYAYGCSVTTNDKSASKPESEYGAQMWTLNKAYKKIIQPTIVSNTTIIGLTTNSGIKGGTFVLSGVENVVIRNMIIEDAYDPFPHHEKNDGYNAQFDTICIQDGSHDIWIDHCTFRDTMTLGHVWSSGTTEEKWQDYDGLLDMKSEDTTDITVSYCRFENHDKTMLIGSSDTEWDGCNRKVTLHHNYFYNCGQRLPMVRQTQIHIFNNFYSKDDNATYDQQYAIGVRNKTLVLSEGNYFDSGIKYSYSGTSSTSVQGSVYSEGDVDESQKGVRTEQMTVLTEAPFEPDYFYFVEPAEFLDWEIPMNAGAGAWGVQLDRPNRRNECRRDNRRSPFHFGRW